MLVTDVLKDPKTSLEQSIFECLITLSLATIQFPEVQLDEFFKNMAFQEMQQKSQFEEEKQVFSFKMVLQYAQQAVLVLAECCFY